MYIYIWYFLVSRVVIVVIGGCGLLSLVSACWRPSRRAAPAASYIISIQCIDSWIPYVL